MPAIGNFAVWVEVNQKQLPEYQVELEADGTEATCYVPSETGKSFSICYSDAIRAIGTSMTIHVDGVRIPNSPLLPPRGLKAMPAKIVKKHGVTSSDTSYEPFVFSDCKLVEDQENAANLSPDLGTIKCTINHVQIHSGHGPGRRRRVKFPPLQVHERAKKGIVHGVQLGNSVVGVQHPLKRSTQLGHIATFKFQYRPMAVLMAGDIVPPNTPKPQRTVSEIIDLTLDNDEGSEKTTRRNKHSHRERDLDVRVKTEVKKERSQTVLDVIDLTI